MQQGYKSEDFSSRGVQPPCLIIELVQYLLAHSIFKVTGSHYFFFRDTHSFEAPILMGPTYHSTQISIAPFPTHDQFKAY